MTEWLSASQIAAAASAAGIEGFPTSRQKVNDRAKKYGWKSRERRAQGGGREYHVSNLPTPIRKAAVGAIVETRPVATTAATPVAVRPSADLTDWQRQVMGARAAILRWIDERAVFETQDTVIARLIDESKSGSLPPDLANFVPIANAKSGTRTGRQKRALCRATIYNWMKARRDHGVDGLAPSLPAEKDMSVPAWAPALLEHYRSPTKPSLAAVLGDKRFVDALPAGTPMPSYDQARRFIGKLDAVTKNKGRMGPQALKALKAYTTRTTDNLWPGAVFTSDGHTFKATVEHPFHGAPFRPELTVVLDVYTRYATGWSIGLAENSIGVLEALSHAMVRKDDHRKGAVPAIWYTDNGPGFRAELLEGTAIGFYDRWGMTQKNSLPYNSQARGVVERFQQVWVKASRRLPTYKGRDMDKEAGRKLQRLTQRALTEAGKSPFDMTWETFKAFAQDVIDDYNATPHSGLPRYRDPVTLRKRYMTPTEAWEAWEADGGTVIQIDPEDAADLFRPYERRKVSRCQVRVLGNVYFSHDLDPHHGEDVQVGYDIHDGSKVWVRDFEGRLLAVAVADGNARPYFDDGTLREASSLVQIKHEQRIKGRMGRLRDKAAEIQAEAGIANPMQLVGRPDEQFSIEHTAPEELTERPDELPVIETAEGERPVFSNELAWARWLTHHAEAATEHDKAQLRNALRQPGFRSLLETGGIEVSALQEIAA
ncbi:MAG: hypothetical protein CMM61_15640 [Rhodospirillaceae bacterium]|nr:hypothetical protein [Rhodospirillaceae bacterium]